LNINLKFKGIEMLKEKFLKPENIFSIKWKKNLKGK
jgi:hypothetical protein